MSQQPHLSSLATSFATITDSIGGGTSHVVAIEGADIHYTCWNMQFAQRPLLLFVHGFRAHAHWWDAVLPYFMENYRIVTMDFSGMGESQHRASYSPALYAREITGLLDALDAGPVTGIAHSYGGSRLLRACHDRPELFARLIVIDSFLYFRDGTRPQLPGNNALRVYPDLQTACARFRLMPAQPSPLAALHDHVARHSLRPVDGGWIWKFDPAIPANGSLEIPAEDLLPRIPVRTDFIYGEHSKVVDRQTAERIVALLPNAGQPIEVPDSHHHLMLDQPLSLVTALRTLLAQDKIAIHHPTSGDHLQ